MLFLLVTETRGAFLQAKSVAEIIASTSRMTIGIRKCFQEWHMEAVMWECSHGKEGCRTPLIQFGQPLLSFSTNLGYT